MQLLCSVACESWHEASYVPAGLNNTEAMEYLIICTSNFDAEDGQAD